MVTLPSIAATLALCCASASCSMSFMQGLKKSVSDAATAVIASRAAAQPFLNWNGDLDYDLRESGTNMDDLQSSMTGYLAGLESSTIRTDGGNAMHFIVHKTDIASKKTWVCLRVQMSLEMSLKNKFVRRLDKSASVNKKSTCDKLVLNLHGSKNGTENDHLTFDFGDHKRHGLELGSTFTKLVDSRHLDSISYLKAIKADKILFNMASKPVEASYTWNLKYFSGNGKMAADSSPVEFGSYGWSYSCVHGFSMNSTDAQKLSLKFKNVRVEQYPDYNRVAAQVTNGDSKWQRVVNCQQDISTVLPIVIGSILICICLATLISYTISKTMVQDAYEQL